MSTLTADDVLRMSRGSLVVRCKLYETSEEGIDSVTRANIEIISAYDDDGVHKYWVIKYADDAPEGRNYEKVCTLSMSMIGSMSDPSLLEVCMGRELDFWEQNNKLWTDTSSLVFACGNIGQSYGALVEIPSCHLELIQHYGAMKALLVMRLRICRTEDHRDILLTILKRFDAFIRLQYTEWRKVQWTLGDMCPPSRR